MTTLFKKIRQKLLMENKTSKYFKYAIGEIVLVVIGILIALQINNWNENRKLEKTKYTLLLALKNELNNNVKALDHYYLQIHKTNSKFNKILLYSVGEYEIPNDSLKYYLSNMMYDRTLSIFNSVEEEAINSGKFELLSDSLKQSLSLLKDFTNSRNSIQDKASFFNFDIDSITTSLTMIPAIPVEFSRHQAIPLHPKFVLSEIELSTLIKQPQTYLILNEIYLKLILDEVWVKDGILSGTKKTMALIEKELNSL